MKSIHYSPSLEEEQEKWFNNIKLIGEISKGTSIYIEDYAYTYLQQCADSDLSNEICAILIGEFDNELDRVIIYGVMLVKTEEVLADNKWLDKKVLNSMEDRIKEYFAKGECIGWMHTQPGYGLMATTQEMEVHKSILGNKGVLMLMDPIYELEDFFMYGDGVFEKKGGFCIYYEKNEEMQKYMEEFPVFVKEEDIDDKVVSEFRELGAKRKNEIIERKRKFKIIKVTGFTAFLALSFIMGIYSQSNKINNLEEDVVNIHKQYKEIEHSIPENSVEFIFTSTEDIKEEGEIEKVEEVEEIEEVEEVEEIEEEYSSRLGKEYDLYTVKMGDNLLKISYNHYNTISKAKEIARYNNILDYNTIYIGQELKIPK